MRTDSTSRSARCSASVRARARLHAKTSRYVFAMRGAVNVIPVPTDAELVAYTTAVAENDRLALATDRRNLPPELITCAPAARAVPERPGDPSLVKHVVFIVRENRTYDQVLGDLEMGARDSSLVDVRPRRHAERARAGASSS